MSKSNRKMRKRLAQIYGNECFFEQARVAERIEEMRRY